MTEQEIQTARERWVKKANALITQSRFRLSVTAQKIMVYLISKIEPGDAAFKPYSFSLNEFCQVCGDIEPGGKNYKLLKDALIELIRNPIGWVTLPNEHETILTWIEPPDLDIKGGVLELQIGKKLAPFLLELKSHFTQYQLCYTLKFRSRYSFRLYELCAPLQYHDEKEFRRSYTVDEMKSILGGEIYSRYCDFNTRVLKPACREINEYSNKHVEIIPHKATGRGGKVERLELVITAKSGNELEQVREAAGVRKRQQRNHVKKEPEAGTSQTAAPERDAIEILRRLHEATQRKEA